MRALGHRIGRGTVRAHSQAMTVASVPSGKVAFG